MANIETAAFSTAAWGRRLEALGGYVMHHDGQWRVLMPLENLNEVRSLNAEINPPGTALAVRQYASGRP